jgi:hypothetical protein
LRQCARLEPAPWEDALMNALRRLHLADFAWWLYGSAALAVRGLPVAPADVDLHVADAFAAGRLFDDVLVTPVERLDGWATTSRSRRSPSSSARASGAGSPSARRWSARHSERRACRRGRAGSAAPMLVRLPGVYDTDPAGPRVTVSGCCR